MGMPRKKWTRVDAAAEIHQIEPGGYVCSIVDVYYDRRRKRLEVTHDVAEGPLAGFFRDQPKKIATRKYVVDGPGESFFRSFLDVLEDSNPQFSIAAWEGECDEMELVGLKFGALMQTLHYVKDGEEKSLVELAKTIAADKVRSGDFTLPAPRSAPREAQPQNGGAAAPDGREDAFFAPSDERVPVDAYQEAQGEAGTPPWVRR